MSLFDYVLEDGSHDDVVSSAVSWIKSKSSIIINDIFSELLYNKV